MLQLNRLLDHGMSITSLLCLLFFLVYLTEISNAERRSNGETCTLCQDGSRITNPNGVIVFDEREWKCSELAQILWLLDVAADCERCYDLHYLGFVECGCPNFEDDNFCALCPQRVRDLPDPNITIPGFDGQLTCQDIIFIPRDPDNEEAFPISCDDQERYRQLCQCPELCSFCRYSDESAENLDRIIPYYTEGDNQVTCLEHVAQASNLLEGDACDDYRTPPVPVNTEGYCGCPKISSPNLCSLCPDGGTLRDPNMVIANVGGLTCQELETYLEYVTDLDTCVAIANRSQACCEVFDLCPPCQDGSYGLGSAKVYDPYNLGCDQIGQAINFGFSLTCEDAQLRFSYFCRCADTLVSECTICPLNQVPPEPSRFIPELNITCGEANDLVSLATNATECADALAGFKIDVAGFCGCGIDTSLFGRCAFCPEGQEQRFQLVPTIEEEGLHNIFALVDGSTISDTQYESVFASPFAPGEAAHLPFANLFGSTVDPDKLPSQGQQCLGLEAIAPYVIEEEFCKAVQESIPICCRTSGTMAPTSSPQPTMTPTTFPTLEPTIMMTNESFWDNFTDYNSTNETMAPTPVPTMNQTMEEEDSAMTWKLNSFGLGLILATLILSFG